MSVSSMTNVAFARRKDVAPVDEAPTTVDEIAAAKADKEETQSAGTSTLAAIAAYIPTEVLTIYVAVVAALNPGAAAVAASNGPQWGAFLVFLVFTPVVVWLVYAGKVRRAGKDLPLSLQRWPKWEMFAATVAYAAWAFALPETPFADFSWYNTAIAAVVVLVATTGLGLIAPVVAQTLDG